MKTDGSLRVQTDALDSFLQQVVQALRAHEKLISRVPQLEGSQNELHRLVKELTLKCESRRRMKLALNGNEVNNAGNEKEGEDSKKGEDIEKEKGKEKDKEKGGGKRVLILPPVGSSSRSVGDDGSSVSSNSSSNSTPRQQKEQVHQEEQQQPTKSKKPRSVYDIYKKKSLLPQTNNDTSEKPSYSIISSIDASSLRTIRKELIGLRSLIKQVQSERDHQMATSLENDRRLESLRIEILGLHRDVSASATVSQINDLQQSVSRSQSEVQSYVNDFRTKFMSDVDTSVKQNLESLMTWYREHEALVESRQGVLESRLATLAKSCDVDALRESVETDSNDIRGTMDHLRRSLKRTSECIQSMKEFEALTTFRRIYFVFRRRHLERGLGAWKEFWLKENEAARITVENARRMRRIVLHRLLRNQRNGFVTWCEYTEWLKRNGEKRKRAVNFLIGCMEKGLTIPLGQTFRQWHRLTIMDRVGLLSITSPVEQVTTSFQEVTYHPEEIIHCFHDDTQGALHFLSREVQRLRQAEVGRLRSEWLTQREENSTNYDNALHNALQQVDYRVCGFERNVNDTIATLSNHLPSINNELATHERTLDTVFHRVKKLEESHGERIDVLFGHKEGTEEKVLTLEKKLNWAVETVQTLTQTQKQANDAIANLTKRLEREEMDHNHTKKELADTISQFRQDMDNAQQAIKANADRCHYLADELHDANTRFIEYRQSSCDEIHRLDTILHTPGVRQPHIRTVISHAVTYEQVAQAKNYVPIISSAIQPLETNNTRNRNNNNIPKTAAGNYTDHDDTPNPPIDLPQDMSAFAHDYAAWIAYQADHEAIMRDIAGTNPEEIVYADDDIESRRRTLLHEFKTFFEETLEKTYPRPGALRQEARLIYVARLMEAIDAALSKHDQVLISANTRLGRVRRTLQKLPPVCVACDRPLRNKARKGTTLLPSSSDSEPLPQQQYPHDTAVPAGNTNVYVAGRTGGSVPTHYVKRGGFKMPATSVNTVTTMATEQRRVLREDNGEGGGGRRQCHSTQQYQSLNGTGDLSSSLSPQKQLQQ